MIGGTVLVILGLGLAVVGLCSGIWVGAIRWNNNTSDLVRRLMRAIGREREETVSFHGFGQLPAPVARYFRRTMREGQPFIRSACIVQKGEFCRAEDSWSPFEAQQYSSAQPPGFVWDASIRLSPLMRVRVRDAYVAGQGSTQAKILSLLPIVDSSASAELNAGALQRYLAEAVWLPTALLPGDALKWSAIDDTSALATLTNSGITVSMKFHFNNEGEVTGVSTPGRYREVDGRYELTPWRGRFRNYEQRDGMRIPLEADVEWQLPHGNYPYWKGRIIEVEYLVDSTRQSVSEVSAGAGGNPLRRVA